MNDGGTLDPNRHSVRRRIREQGDWDPISFSECLVVVAGIYHSKPMVRAGARTTQRSDHPSSSARSRPPSSSPSPPCLMVGCTRFLLLGGEPGLADFILFTAQLDVEDALHGGEDLLIGGGLALLHLLDDGGGGVALLSEVVLLHGRGEALARLGNRPAYRRPHRLRLDDLVRPINLGVELADAARAALRLLRGGGGTG